MQLRAVWVNATRPSEERAEIERLYRDFFISHFGSVVDAFKQKESFHRQNEHPRHPWVLAEAKARYIATHSLPPCEAQGVRLKLEWTQ